MKEVLIVYYTRTGNSRRLADEISIKLHGDKDQIISDTKYKGISGFIRGVFRTIRKKEDMINYEEDPSKYRVVVIVSPIWSSNIPPAVRTYIKENISNIQNYGFIINGSFKENQKAYKNFTEELPDPISEYIADNSNIEYEICQKDLEDFADKIRAIIEQEEENERE
jgi:flavodoxin